MIEQENDYIDLTIFDSLKDYDLLRPEIYSDENNLPEFRFVIPTFPEKTLGCLVSEGGTGKSIFAMNVCSNYACGRNYLSNLDRQFSVKKNINVAYLSLEDSSVVCAHRLNAILNSKINNFTGEEKEEIKKRFLLINNNISIDLMSDDYNKSLATINNLKKIALNVDLMFIDTFIRTHSSNENDAGEMSGVMKVFENIIKECDCSIIFLHHVNKEGGFRGSSAIRDNVRWLASLSVASPEEVNDKATNSDRCVVFKIEKSNNSMIPKPMLFYKEMYKTEKVKTVVLKDISDKYKEKEQAKRGTRKWK